MRLPLPVACVGAVACASPGADCLDTAVVRFDPPTVVCLEDPGALGIPTDADPVPWCVTAVGGSVDDGPEWVVRTDTDVWIGAGDVAARLPCTGAAAVRCGPDFSGGVDQLDIVEADGLLPSDASEGTLTIVASRYVLADEWTLSVRYLLILHLERGRWP